jgi:hypothetical protein
VSIGEVNAARGRRAVDHLTINDNATRTDVFAAARSTIVRGAVVARRVVEENGALSDSGARRAGTARQAHTGTVRVADGAIDDARAGGDVGGDARAHAADGSTSAGQARRVDADRAESAVGAYRAVGFGKAHMGASEVDAAGRRRAADDLTVDDSARTKVIASRGTIAARTATGTTARATTAGVVLAGSALVDGRTPLTVDLRAHELVETHDAKRRALSELVELFVLVVDARRVARGCELCCVQLAVGKVASEGGNLVVGVDAKVAFVILDACSIDGHQRALEVS